MLMKVAPPSHYLLIQFGGEPICIGSQRISDSGCLRLRDGGDEHRDQQKGSHVAGILLLMDAVPFSGRHLYHRDACAECCEAESLQDWVPRSSRAGRSGSPATKAS